MSEPHTVVLRWEGDAALGEQFAGCAREHGADVESLNSDEDVVVTMTLEGNELQELRDVVDALLVALSTIEDTN